MNNNKSESMLITIISAVGAIAIIIGAIIIYRKFHFTDILTFSAIVIVVLVIFVTAVDSFISSLFHSSGSTYIASNNVFTNEDKKSDKNSNEFIMPHGFVPDKYDPEHKFTDFEGHEYHNYYGMWVDENGNACPDYMKDMYGISSYESRHDDE